MSNCGCSGPSMMGDGVQVVLFPKYVTLTGNVASGYRYYSDAFDVTTFNVIDVEIDVLALSGTVRAQISTSSDGIQWSEPGGSGTVTIGAVATIRLTMSGPKRFVKLVFDDWNSTADVAVLEARGVFRTS